MANPLDMVTQDDSDETQLSPFDAAKMRGISIRPTSGMDVASAGNDPLTRAVAPQPEQQQWTMDDLMKGLAALKEHVMTGEFSPGTRAGNRLFGTGGEERYQTWPERMVRSGVTLPGDVASGAEPILDPVTGRTSERVIERAQDLAGLAGGSALAERPGAASMGSGPVRQFRRGANENLNPEAMSNAPEFYVKPSRDELFVAPVKKEYKAYPEIDDPNKWRVIEISHDAYSQTSKDVKSGLSPEAAKSQAQAMTADSPAKYVVAGGKDDPHIGQQFKSEAEAKAFMRKNRKTVHDLYMRDPRTVEAAGRTHGGEDLHLTGFDTPEAAHEALAHLNSGGNYDLTNGFKMLPGKSTTLRSDTQQPGAAIAAAASSKGPAPVFYSALEHATTNAAQETMSPQQWLGYLKNQPGVKQEELAWTGLPEWLTGQEGKVKKEDVQAYLDEHKVEIKDVTKGQTYGETPEDAIGAYIDENHEVLHAEAEREVRRADPELERQDPAAFADAIEDAITEIADDHMRGGVGGGTDITKYSSYQLPGGENYREHLLTLPERPGASTARAKLEDPNRDLRSTEFDRLKAQSEPYRSSHWDEPNVLAHVRTNDRDVGGKKSLHIEEIQSDWHQQGRKQGYQTKTEGDPLLHVGQGLNKVPDAPFKTTWPELALKRMIRHAAENGYDRISWTPGEAQAARYDLSKHVDSIGVKPNIGGGRRVVVNVPSGVHASGLVDNTGKIVTGFGAFKDAVGKNIEDVVGKDIAEKILKSQGQVELKGDDFKVGGEGMREFYDKMLPKMAEKIGKAHGVKIKTTTLDGQRARVLDENGKVVNSFDDKAMAERWLERTFTPETAAKYRVEEKQQPVHYFDIPPSLRDHAIGKGFPLYMSGVPFPLTPVDHDPFKEKK